MAPSLASLVKTATTSQVLLSWQNKPLPRVQLLHPRNQSLPRKRPRLRRQHQRLSNQHLSKKLLSFNLASVSLRPPLPRRSLWRRVSLCPKSRELDRLAVSFVKTSTTISPLLRPRLLLLLRLPKLQRPLRHRTMLTPQFPTCAEQSAHVSHSRSRSYLITT